MSTASLTGKRKKSVRVAGTAFAAVTAGVAATIPATPAEALTAYQLIVYGNGVPTSKGMQVCGHNQNGTPTCHYATQFGNDSWSTANWWWLSNITLWWKNHHSKSNAGCNIQSPGIYKADGWAYVGASPSNPKC
jgi:hypothetical protein